MLRVSFELTRKQAEELAKTNPELAKQFWPEEDFLTQLPETGYKTISTPDGIPMVILNAQEIHLSSGFDWQVVKVNATRNTQYSSGYTLEAKRHEQKKSC